MAKKQKQEWMSFHEDGKRYMQCKVCQSEYVQTGEDAVAVTCSTCVTRITTSQMTLEDFYPSMKIKKTGRPAGWHWMKEFVDKDGTVYHLGKEQPKLKGTKKPTKVKPVTKKRKKRRTKEEMLLAIDAERKAELKKAVQKQKDFLNHNIDKG